MLCNKKNDDNDDGDYFMFHILNGVLMAFLTAAILFVCLIGVRHLLTIYGIMPPDNPLNNCQKLNQEV